MQKRSITTTTIVLEILNAVTHGIGLIGSLIALAFLFGKADYLQLDQIEMTSLVIYSVTLISLYLASTLYHSFVFTKVHRFFQIIDHSNIFLLIAGTYTPYCLIVIANTLGRWLLAGIWLLAIGGILLHILTDGRFQNVETTIYVAMGWLCMLAVKPLYANLSTSGFWLLVAGGIVFTLGAVIYSITRRFKGGLAGHLIWHLFVMLGTTCMFLSIYLNL
ncbi:PAQR family membrane homeostasis protein TrhA [Lactobacillus selangorensis]|nr:hemolysin III family protein [Lactobacillus selangorensis]